MNKKDDSGKTVIALCGTALALFYAAAKFGRIENMGKISKGIMALSVIAILLNFILILVAIFLEPEQDFCYGIEKEVSQNYSKLYKTANEWNLAYWIDSSNESKKVPKGKKYLHVKDDVDFSKIKFENAKEIEEIHFCASQLAISAEQANELKAAKIFLDGGKSCVEIK